MTIAVDWNVKQQNKQTKLSLSGLILAQNDDGPLKWANGPYPIQIHANFQILMGHLKFLWALFKI